MTITQKLVFLLKGKLTLKTIVLAALFFQWFSKGSLMLRRPFFKSAEGEHFNYEKIAFSAKILIADDLKWNWISSKVFLKTMMLTALKQLMGRPMKRLKKFYRRHFLDMRMPEKDGMEAMTDIRQEDELKDILSFGQAQLLT